MLILLLAYLGGILTILSPCILPVLPFVFARAGRSFARSTLPRFDEYERADRPQFRFVNNADGEYIFADGRQSPVCPSLLDLWL